MQFTHCSDEYKDGGPRGTDRGNIVFLRIVLVSLKGSKMQERSRGKKCGEAKKRFCETNSCKMQLLPGDHRSAKARKTTKLWCIERLLIHTYSLPKILNVSL